MHHILWEHRAHPGIMQQSSPMVSQDPKHPPAQCRITAFSDAHAMKTHLALAGLWETPTCWHHMGAAHSAHLLGLHQDP